MTDREKQIEELAKKLKAYAYDLRLDDNDDCLNVADFIVNTLKYCKMNEVTLRLDSGDRSAEEIAQIAEAFNGDIKKQVAKEILQEFWQIEHGQTELDNVCIRLAEKFGLLKELQGE